ncbi:MAG: sensor domain-containing diguanylate cyclase [Desulfarculus sp.]|nr:sensor domain-containing diguanylate cyclase [Desulfarculus sp.]
MVHEGTIPVRVLDDLYDGVYFLDPRRRITYWNSAAEKLTGYRAGEVLGRSCADNILVHVNDLGDNLCESGCPVALTLADGQAREAEVFLHHKDGHRLPVLVRVSPLYDGQGNLAGALEVFADNSTRLEANQRLKELEQLAMLDPLTKLPNRRYLERQVEARLAELTRQGWPFGVIFMDLDHFKAINDRHGHEAGDQVLVMVSRALELSSRPFDLVGRWGGEEFLAVIPTVDQKALGTVAQRYRMLAANCALYRDHEPLRATISLGATLAQPGDTLDSLLARADQFMYQSKKNGRDQVTLG